MTSILPPVPKFIFSVFEPLSLLAGFVGTLADPEWFVAEQIAFSPAEKLSRNAIVIALQLGNLYLLLAMIGIAVLYTTTERSVVRAYILALAIADIGHLAVTYYILEFERFVDVANWNSVAWGNIGITILLFLSRSAYLMGVFGPDRRPGDPSQNQKSQ